MLFQLGGDDIDHEPVPVGVVSTTTRQRHVCLFSILPCHALEDDRILILDVALLVGETRTVCQGGAERPVFVAGNRTVLDRVCLVSCYRTSLNLNLLSWLGSRAKRWRRW